MRQVSVVESHSLGRPPLEPLSCCTEESPLLFPHADPSGLLAGLQGVTRINKKDTFISTEDGNAGASTKPRQVEHVGKV